MGARAGCGRSCTASSAPPAIGRADKTACGEACTCACTCTCAHLSCDSGGQMDGVQFVTWAVYSSPRASPRLHFTCTARPLRVGLQMKVILRLERGSCYP